MKAAEIVLVTPFHSTAWADESLSSRAYRASIEGKLLGIVCRATIDLIFIWQGTGHCGRAYIAERERLQAPPESR